MKVDSNFFRRQFAAVVKKRLTIGVSSVAAMLAVAGCGGNDRSRVEQESYDDGFEVCDQAGVSYTDQDRAAGFLQLYNGTTDDDFKTSEEWYAFLDGCLAAASDDGGDGDSSEPAEPESYTLNDAEETVIQLLNDEYPGAVTDDEIACSEVGDGTYTCIVTLTEGTLTCDFSPDDSTLECDA